MKKKTLDEWKQIIKEVEAAEMGLEPIDPRDIWLLNPLGIMCESYDKIHHYLHLYKKILMEQMKEDLCPLELIE